MRSIKKLQINPKKISVVLPMKRICFIIKEVYLSDISFILMTIKSNQCDYQEKLDADHEKV